MIQELGLLPQVIERRINVRENYDDTGLLLLLYPQKVIRLMIEVFPTIYAHSLLGLPPCTGSLGSREASVLATCERYKNHTKCRLWCKIS